MARFVLMYYPQDGGEERFEIEADQSVRIGAKSDNDVVIPQQDVSRHHAILRASAGNLQITDLKSKNGTFINGNRTESARFRAGDLINLSSARLVVVEMDGQESPISGAQHLPQTSKLSDSTSDTKGHRIHHLAVEMARLLDITAAAVQRGSLMEPLNWGVDALGLLASVVLYVGDDGMVSVVSSAGDLGPMISNHGNLREVTRDPKLVRSKESHIRQFHNVGEELLIAPLINRHMMVVRYAKSPPDAAEIQALAAAVDIVLASTVRQLEPPPSKPQGAAPSSQGTPPNEEISNSLLQLDIRQARQHFEQWFVSKVLEECEWNQSEAARRLGLSRAGLFKKIRTLGIKNPAD